ncbi:MAG TPA: class I SAM-dependent methyltransferase [Candidatus Angelobacter sp.]
MTKSPTTSEFFRRIGVKGWRKSAFFTFSSRYPVLRRWLISQLLHQDKNILSIGCGSGELESDLARTGRRVAGLDICYELLERARKRGLKNLVQADALRLPFVSSSFDLVVFPESIGYFSMHEGLPGVARVLKQRGRILITAYATNFASDDIYKKSSVQDFTGELQSAGFSIVDHKLLTIKNSSVTEVSSPDHAEIIYILAQKQGSFTPAPS